MKSSEGISGRKAAENLMVQPDISRVSHEESNSEIVQLTIDHFTKEEISILKSLGISPSSPDLISQLTKLQERTRDERELIRTHLKEAEEKLESLMDEYKSNRI